MFIQKFKVKNSDRNDLIILQKIERLRFSYIFMVTIFPVLLKTYFQPFLLFPIIFTLVYKSNLFSNELSS